MSDICKACNGYCCYDIIIRVTGFDVARIARAQALPFDAIVNATDDPQTTPGAFRIGSTFKSLYLAKNDQIPGACTFLMHLPGDERRCGIYRDRPHVCAVYPMTIRNGSVDLRDDVKCAKTSWNMSTLSYATWRTALAIYSMEWDIYRCVVETWNASPLADRADVSTFFAYAADACDAIDRDAQIASDAFVSDARRWNDAPTKDAEPATQEQRFAIARAHAAAALAARSSTLRAPETAAGPS